jgi:hypothetical protein
MEEKITAIHEAGHVVVARLLGAAVSYVALFDTDGKGHAGAQTHSLAHAAVGMDRASQIRGARGDAMIALAGPIAQETVKPQKLKTMQRRIPAGWRGDYENAQQRLIEIVMLETDPTFELSQIDKSVELNAERRERAAALFTEISAELVTLTRKHWPAIERTADELLRVRIISGDEIDAIIRTSGEREK